MRVAEAAQEGAERASSATFVGAEGVALSALKPGRERREVNGPSLPEYARQ